MVQPEEPRLDAVAQPPNRAAKARYLFAVTAAALAVLVIAALVEATDQPVYAPLIGAVVLAVWYGGVGPALTAVVVGWSLSLVFVVEPRGEVMPWSSEEITSWWVNLGAALVVVAVSEVLRLGRRRAEVTAAVAVESIQRVELLQELSAALSRAAASSDVARVLTRQGTTLLGAQGAALALIDNGELLLVEPTGLAREVRTQRLAIDSEMIITRAARDGVPVRVADRAELEASYPDSAAGLPRRAQGAIAAPVLQAGRVVGSIGFLFTAPGAVDEEIEALTLVVADLAGQALERARLYERELEMRQALDRILQVAPRFHADTSLEVTEAICREARTTFGADFGVLWRVRDDRLELIRMDPPSLAFPPGQSWPLEDFPAFADAVRTFGVVFVPDVLEEARGAGLELVLGMGVRSSLRTPIVIGGRTELMLALSWQQVVSQPDPSTLAVVRRFADQAGLALEGLERRRAEADAALRADAARRLQEVTSALSLAATPVDVTNTCLEHALASVGADAGFVVLTGPGGTAVEFVTSSGYGDDELEGWAAFGLEDEVPFARVISGGEPVWAFSPDEMAVFTAREAGSDQSWAALPLRTGAGVQGALHLSFRHQRTLSTAEQEWLVNVVSQCAQALERSRLFAEEQRLRARAERVQSMTAAFANALTRSDVAEAVVREIGGAVDADGAALAVVAEDRGLLRVLAWEGYPDDVVEAWRELPLDSESPATQAVRRRRTGFYATLDRLHEEIPDPAPGSVPPGHSSFLFVPLAVGRRVNGVLTLSWSAPAVLSQEDLGFVETLASQAAQGLDRASHFELERTIAETLQRSVLPASLPRVDGVELAARYLPGTAELDVGGDWFDAIALPDERLGLVVGDVVGKGVLAAASMGQLRNALRAFSVERLKPSSALARLNRLAEEALDTTFATVVYAVLDPATMTCRFSSAGHPPPAVVYPDGRVELLEEGRGLPLGAGIETKFRQATIELPAGALLVLYSDGLVERRRRSIDEGLDALRAALLEAPRDPERMLEHVLETVVGSAERGDDIALLAARLLPVAPRPLELRISSSPRSLELVRDALRTWLEGTPLSRADSEDVLLACWEVCANAIEHAVEPRDDTVRVSARIGDAAVEVAVEDSGRWGSPEERPDRGLGLRLMKSVMSSVDIQTTDRGTRVTVSKSLA